jgi:hypothetical protein
VLIILQRDVDQRGQVVLAGAAADFGGAPASGSESAGRCSNGIERATESTRSAPQRARISWDLSHCPDVIASAEQECDRARGKNSAMRKWLKAFA